MVKVGRTQMQDAVLTTLGREMGAYAEAFNRDRWRIYKCEERLRVVNLGGTAIGTGLAAPRQYIFRVVDTLRELTGIGFARAENLVEATQNADVFVEVSGILKACAATLLKICGDLRLLARGPEAGLGEIRLPQRQAGSSIMPGKVNPVIPEAVSQAAMLVMGHDATIAIAAAVGSLELNPFLPLVADCLLESLDAAGARLRDPAQALRGGHRGRRGTLPRARRGLDARRPRRLVPELGYEAALPWSLRGARDRAAAIREVVSPTACSTAEQFDELLSRRGRLPARHAADARRLGGGVMEVPHEPDGRPQGHAPAHRHLRPPQRRQVEPAQRHHPAGGLASSPTTPAPPPTRWRSRWSCCRSARCCSSTPPASTTSARSASCASRRPRRSSTAPTWACWSPRPASWGEFEDGMLAEFRERATPGRRRLQQDRPRRAAPAPSCRVCRSSSVRRVATAATRRPRHPRLPPGAAGRRAGRTSSTTPTILGDLVGAGRAGGAGGAHRQGGAARAA